MTKTKTYQAPPVPFHEDFYLDIADESGLSLYQVRKIVSDFICVTAAETKHPTNTTNKAFWRTVRSDRKTMLVGIVGLVSEAEYLARKADAIRDERTARRLDLSIAGMHNFVQHIAQL